MYPHPGANNLKIALLGAHEHHRYENLCYMAPRGLICTPFVTNDHPITTQVHRGLSEVTPKLRFFSQHMPARKPLSPHWGPVWGPILEPWT